MKCANQVLPVIVAIALASPNFAQQGSKRAAVWNDPGNVAALNVLEGPGGRARAPGNTFRFIEESKGGTTPKFVVQDENGVKWRVKLGPEAKLETAAARLLWATGYYADEDYYRPQIRVEGMKATSSSKAYISEGGIVRGARLERNYEGTRPQSWSWQTTSGGRTREFNGLKVMMALINNWDLKEINNSIYGQSGVTQRYVVSDLGASFGRTGDTFMRSKGVLNDYANSKFVDKVTAEHVDFVMHDRPCVLVCLFNPPYCRERVRMEKVTKHIPIEDARWLGERLGRLSTAQIRDCFRAAGYTPAEVDGYTRVLKQRIDTLKSL